MPVLAMVAAIFAGDVADFPMPLTIRRPLAAQNEIGTARLKGGIQSDPPGAGPQPRWSGFGEPVPEPVGGKAMALRRGSMADSCGYDGRSTRIENAP